MSTGKDTERPYLVAVFKFYTHSDMKGLCASKEQVTQRETDFSNVKISQSSNRMCFLTGQ